MTTTPCPLDGCDEAHTKDEFRELHPGVEPPEAGLEVPVERDPYGRPTKTVTATSREAADHWDDRLWRATR